MKDHSKGATAATAKNVELSAKNFRLEYEVYPVKLEVIVFSVGGVMRELLNMDGDLNEQDIKFLDLNPRPDGIGGLVVRGEEVVPWLTDAWGEPYRILCDVNFDGKIDHPFKEGFIEKDVIVWSAGKDGVDGTQDDIWSWK